MSKLLRRTRAAILMGLTWAVVWGPLAVLLGLLVIDPDNSMDEMWIMIGAIPGFLGGVVFSIVLGIAAGRRRLDELSVARVGMWGALAGTLVGALPFVIGDAARNESAVLLGVCVVGGIALMSGLSAAASLAIARRTGASEPPRIDVPAYDQRAPLGTGAPPLRWDTGAREAELEAELEARRRTSR